MIRFFSRRCFNLEAGDFSHKKQPPPGVGYFILYFSANSICFFLPLPEMFRSLFLLISPDFSYEVSVSFFAQSGRRISKSNCSSIVFIAEDICDIGRCPTTSPVAINFMLCLSAYSLAFLSINILQSLHGLIPTPVPCCGFFRMFKYSDKRGSLLTLNVFSLTVFELSSRLHPPHPNGRAKWRAVISKFWSWRSRIVNFESSPPE